MDQKNIRKYFWDVDFEKMNLKERAFFVIERILEMGDKKTTDWMFKNYGENEISDVLNSSRRLSKRSQNYWKLVLQP
ncbi:MAG: hypothetical protein NTX55_01575 [Candidatus Parcubacteria bacterium]|nr:hypothetical protein [Candidatus Parcubacteria bacterium]